jgi:hypothetical protein
MDPADRSWGIATIAGASRAWIALAEPGEYGQRIRERIDHHSLSLRHDLNVRPARPSDLAVIVDTQAGRDVQAPARVATGRSVRTRSAGDPAAACAGCSPAPVRT